MKVMATMATKTSVAGLNPATETILLPEHQASFLAKMSRDINPDMHRAFGLPHAIRTILDRVEASGIDLTAAGSEHEIAQLAAEKLRTKSGRREMPG
jgi:hypothetical protein